LYKKLKSWLSNFYSIPWCVPSWNGLELAATIKNITLCRIKHGNCSDVFSNAIKKHISINYTLPVNRGRTAIEVALLSFGIRGGDEVILPAYICSEVLEAVLAVNATPIFADINNHLQVSVDSIKKQITPNTKCIIAAHLFGMTSNIDKIEVLAKENGIKLIDDAAQTFGATVNGRFVGSFGDCGVISCGPGKALASCGGGLLITNNKKLHQKFLQIPLQDEDYAPIIKRIAGFWLWRRLRAYTLPFKIILERIFGSLDSFPSEKRLHMSNIEAAIATKQFLKLEQNITNRKRNGRLLLNSLEILSKYSISSLAKEHVLLKLVCVIPKHIIDVQKLITIFASVGIECQKGYWPCHQKLELECDLPITDSSWDEVLCIPLESPISSKQIHDLKKLFSELKL